MIYGRKFKIGNFEGLKKFAIIATASVLGILAALYLVFLFVLPNVINLSKFTPQIEDELKKVVKFDLALVEPKLKTTPRLGVKVQAKKIALKYSDGKEFASLAEPSLEVNLPSLIFGHLNLDKIYTKDAQMLVVLKDKKYTFEDYLVPQASKESESSEESASQLPFELRNINVIVDNASLVFEDKNIDKSYALNTKDTKISLNSLKGPVKVKTTGGVSILQGKHFADFDIDLAMPLPQVSETPEAPPEEAVQFEAFNPFENFDKLGFYTNIYVDLKISDLENFNAKGLVKISDTTLMHLPKSNATLEFKGDKVNLNSSLYIAKDEFLKAEGLIKTGKKPKIDLRAKADKLSLSNLKSIIAATLDVLSISHDLKNAGAAGYLTCDFYIKSDMKNLESKGFLNLIDGSLGYPSLGLSVTKIGSRLDFSNNKLNIKDTSALVNGAKFALSGEILSNSNLTLNVNSDPIKIIDLINLGLHFKAIRQQDIADFIFRGGTAVIKVALRGNLQNIAPTADVILDKPALAVKSLGVLLNTEKITVAARPDKKDKNDFTLDILASNTLGTIDLQNGIPKIPFKVPSVKIAGNSKTLTVAPTDAWSNSSHLKASGKIDDYMSEKLSFNFKGNGGIHPTSITSLVPAPNRKYIKSAGVMPIEGELFGDFFNIKFISKITSNPQNYVSAINIDNITGATNTLNIDLNVKGTDLCLNDIYINSSKGGRIATVKGALKRIDTVNPLIQGLSVSIPQKLSISAPALGNFRLSANANINVSGSALNPVITGSANASNISYPDMGVTVDSANADFKRSSINASASNIKIAKSDFSGDLEVSSDFSKGIVINQLNFNSNILDADALMKLTAAAPNTQTTPGPAAPSGFTIKSGKGTIGKAKMGGLSAENISFNYNCYNNLFKLTNLVASAYDGSIKGDVTYHLSNLKATTDVSAAGINMGKFAQAASGVVIPVTGTLNGILQVSLVGATPEQQMRTLNGSAKFNIANGELKEFIRLENFLYAGNIITQNIFGFNLNSAISAVSKNNTGEFRNLDGVINFANGWAEVQSFKSQGPNMSLFASGKYNLLTNFADLQILGRISPKVASAMGPLGDISISGALEKLPSGAQTVLNVLKSIAPTNSLLSEVSQSDINKIPALSASTTGETKEFQVTINGLATKTSSVKSFKWAAKPGTLNTQTTQTQTQGTTTSPSASLQQTTTKPQTTTTQESGTTTTKPSLQIQIPGAQNLPVKIELPNLKLKIPTQ